MAEATEMQRMEMEMVQGMYETFELISDAPPKYAVQLSATPDDPSELKVIITYPSELYPEEASCVIEIENVAKHKRIQTASLLKEIATISEENLGMHCVLMILQCVQEFLCNHAEEEEKAELHRKGEALNAAAGEVKEDPTIRMGTAVTKDLFAEWSRKHLAEKAKREEEQEKKAHKASASALTGRQLWDNTLKSAEWELFGAADKDNADGDGEDVDYNLADDLNEENFDFDDDE